MYKGVIFDLDGTLLNSIDDLGNSVNRVLLNHGLEPHTMDKYQYFVGNGIRKLVERAFPDNYIHLDSAFEEFVIDYRDNCTVDSVLYPGIDDLLLKLDALGIKMAICTNKAQSLTDKIVEKMFLGYNFVEVIGDRFDDLNKPNPYYVYKILDKMDLKKSEVLFVGDSDVDMKTSINAGLDGCGVSWGFRTVDELKHSGAKYIVDEALEILNIIQKGE